MLDIQCVICDVVEVCVCEMQLDIGDCWVCVFFVGVFGICQVSVGLLVMLFIIIVMLDDIEWMYVDFQVLEVELVLLIIGDKVSVISVVYFGCMFDGEVVIIDICVDLGICVVIVCVDFINVDYVLCFGMLLDVCMFRLECQVLVILEIVVVQVGCDVFVYWVKVDQSVECIDVIIGVCCVGVVEICSGIQVGDCIVVDGIGKFCFGFKVQVYDVVLVIVFVLVVVLVLVVWMGVGG